MCCNRRNRNRQALAVTVLKAASDKYQQRQEQQQLSTTTSSVSARSIEDKVTAEPPSYDAVVNSEGEGRGSSDAEKQRDGDALTSGRQYRSWWQQKKAEKAARKAEKWAEKARRSGYVYCGDGDEKAYVHLGCKNLVIISADGSD